MNTARSFQIESLIPYINKCVVTVPIDRYLTIMTCSIYLMLSALDRHRFITHIVFLEANPFYYYSDM